MSPLLTSLPLEHLYSGYTRAVHHGWFWSGVPGRECSARERLDDAATMMTTSARESGRGEAYKPGGAGIGVRGATGGSLSVHEHSVAPPNPTWPRGLGSTRSSVLRPARAYAREDWRL